MAVVWMWSPQSICSPLFWLPPGTPKGLPGLNLLENLKTERPIKRKEIFGESFAHDIADIENPEASLLFRWTIEGKWKLLLTYDGEVNRYKSASTERKETATI